MRFSGAWSILLLLSFQLLSVSSSRGTGNAKPGDAGYALVFHDNVIIKEDFNDFPTTAMTFEAWISTSDFCHPGAVMSYALKTDSQEEKNITKASNHFVIFDVKNVIACHDFEFIDIVPDWTRASCHGYYNKTETDFEPKTGKLADREGKWHHLAVTWDSTKRGETIVYIDGSIVGTAWTNHTNTIQQGGAFMLGGEQDCYAGCTDPKQGFYGLMDEVRIWNIARTQDEIVRTMRSTGGDLQGASGLVAYWKFDDPGTDGFEKYGILVDSSGHGNDLDVLIPPVQYEAVIVKDEKKLLTGGLKFKNNYAMNPGFNGMPQKDITIEFWARSGQITGSGLGSENYAEFFSFSAIMKGDGNIDNDNGYADSSLIDDAIRIERYLKEYNNTTYLKNAKTNTLGSISIHINSNREGNGKHNDNWLDFAANWVDDEWHHIAMTWSYDSGETKLYFDGQSITPFWRAEYGHLSDADPKQNGVSNVLAARTERSEYGSLVIGQNQECYAGCFSPSSAFDGSMANVRIWNRVLSSEEISKNMFTNDVDNPSGLVTYFKFDKEKVKGEYERNLRVYAQDDKTYLELGSFAPTFQFSTVPLTTSEGVPISKPKPGNMGYSLELNDKQLLIVKNFNDFPSDAITVEFWIWSIDGCREGVPFSYAHGDYQLTDNAFLIFNYQDWGIAIMEDEGLMNDHNAGFGSTDGKWHHIAVTWESSTGTAILYDNALPLWRVGRAKGKTIPQGGTLVIGREQDCLGGCFDSAPGATGDIQTDNSLEYGPQDFYGLIEEVRIWRRVRTADEIRDGMIFDKDTGAGTSNDFISSRDPDLVAWWKFDEGNGYSVKDETDHGHTLRILSDPSWVVPVWVETCGDGYLDATEECDDGNTINGDGCDRKCKVETGYTCSNSSPSICFRGKTTASTETYTSTSTSSSPTRPAETTSLREDTHVSAAEESPSTDMSDRDATVTQQSVDDNVVTDETSSPSKSSKKSGSAVGTVFLVLFVLLLIALLAFVAYTKKETIYEHVPPLRTAAHGVGALFGRRYYQYDLAAVDPEEAYVSPGFVDSQPPAPNRTSGASVPYEPIRDVTPRHPL